MYIIEVIGGDALAMRLIAPSYAEGNPIPLSIAVWISLMYKQCI